ncbi:hypothetical protein [Streptomyces sp. NPDC000410]|uniref:hypothetical protein n=1 Tax=Streptomyces sp. NPDC000410 TaxID=3154254 RepID=UPI00332CA6CD
MALVNHQEVEVTITAVASVGSQVDANGTTGFIDQVKHPSWWSTEVAPPQMGDRLHAVVLDDSRTPPRLSALQKDIDIARALTSSPHAPRRYEYVGDPGILAAVQPGSEGRVIRTAADIDTWMPERDSDEPAEPFTYVVDVAGHLRLAPRRSEHVACAGRGWVLGAGEISFRRQGIGWAVTEISNQSTGYCPDLASWPAVAEALDHAGLIRPDGFTHEFVFRRCEDCGELNVVREDDFVCVFCGEDLPRHWNVSP